MHAHCQTLENKSSSTAPNPLPEAGGFEPAVPVDGPVLLAHPPNSSSAATLGWTLKPPPDPGMMGVLAKDPPVAPQPRVLEDAAGGLLAAAGAAGAAGSGVAHAPPPHTSAPAIPAAAKAGVAVSLGGDV